MLSNEYSKFVYAATTKFAVKLDPDTVKVCAAEALPKHFVNGDNVPVLVIVGCAMDQVLIKRKAMFKNLFIWSLILNMFVFLLFILFYYT